MTDTLGAASAAGPAPHLFDPVTQLHHIVWHRDPNLERLIRHVIETTRPDRFVETGTHMGWTSLWVARNYPSLPIYTVEVDPTFHGRSVENLAPYPQAHVALGHSPDFLRALLPLLGTGLTMFWLDAHWYPPVPLRDECRVVSQLDRYVCLLDDFSCWGPDFNGDTFYRDGPTQGPACYNDLSYVHDVLASECYRPCYEPRPGYNGAGLFLKGVDYVPPAELMRRETLAEHLESRKVPACLYPPFPPPPRGA